VRGSSEDLMASIRSQILDKQGQRPDTGRLTSEVEITHQMQTSEGRGDAGCPIPQGKGSLSMDP
jgi:hypothetical protein